MNTRPDLLERWRSVVAWEGFYEVSDRGRVRSVDRSVEVPGRGTWRRHGKVLKLWTKDDGHVAVVLSRDGVPHYRYVHLLVLEAFGPPRPPGHQGLHGPGGPADNRWPENLYWGTRERNLGPDRVRDGTDNRGERHPDAKLTEAIVRDCRQRYAAGEQGIALAAEFGVTHHVMSKAINRKTWRHVT